MSFKERDGAKLAYLDEGSDEPPFVFIHGWTCNRSYFAPQHDHFKTGHRVVSVDLRGHGESDQGQAGYAIGDFADEVTWLIGELGLDRPIVVGHSMGGLVALQMAAEHPESVRAIVMVDPAPLALPPAFRAKLQSLIDAIDAGDQQPRRGFIAAMFLPFSPPDIRTRITEEMCSVPAHVAAGAMRGVLDFDGVAAAKKVDVPALHIAGTPPRNPPHLMTEWLPNVVHGWPVGAGHFNMLEAPIQVNEMIERFADHYVMRAPASTGLA